MVEILGLPVRKLRQTDTVRLIPYSYAQAPALRPLAASPEALEEIARIEQLTNPRAQSGTLNPLAPTTRAAPATSVRNASYIHAAFAYRRPTGNRFNGPEIGAWYAGFTADTALAEVTWHVTRALRAIGRYDQEKEYVGLLADFDDTFPDCRRAATRPAYLDSDPKVAYPAGQDLARALRAAGMPGLIYSSARHIGGTCIAAFRPDVVLNVRHGPRWNLAWNGRPEPEIRQVA